MAQDKDIMSINSFEENLIQSVKQNPLYGYQGRIDEIRSTEYAHLGGTKAENLESNYF